MADKKNASNFRKDDRFGKKAQNSTGSSFSKAAVKPKPKAKTKPK